MSYDASAGPGDRLPNRGVIDLFFHEPSKPKTLKVHPLFPHPAHDDP
jgi:hypothetical protein